MGHIWTEIQRQWIAELRSGEYDQGAEFLCAENKYCCLGVACRVIKPGCEIPENASALSRSGVRRLGLLGSYGDLKSPDTIAGAFVHALSVANDTGVTFAQIADYIEAHPENVFVQPDAIERAAR